jgi:polyribonucleotide nucleotidyltransferase
VIPERTFSREIGGQNFEVGVGLLAQNAAASCTIRYGETMVLVTVADGDAREGIDFFPLTVDFEERMYAIGKIPGSFFRREGRPSTEATLAARMTDRPIRPLFPKGFKREVQVVITLLSSDRETPADVLGTTGASIVLGMSHLPFQGPVSALRVGRIDGQFKAFPTYSELETSDLDLIVAGTAQSVVMIEAGATEVSEADILAAIEFARGVIAQLNDFQQEIVNAVGVPKLAFDPPADTSDIKARIAATLEGELERVLGSVMDEGFTGIDNLATFAHERLADPLVSKSDVRRSIEDVIKPMVRQRILRENKRADDRPDDQIRELKVRVGLIPRTHGSGLFQRGQTQVLSVATLGPIGDRQRMDSIAPTQFKRYLHHYNFPPYSVGEARFMRGPGRREIGHGMLAERSLEPMLPSFDDFPYTIRVVSDTLMSNGSSSMASVCGSTLALMDAGVPIKAPVAGVAMGLITEEGTDQYRVLTDIAGIEDAFGDMDFKVAGTRKGITGVQLDIKLKSLPAGLFETVFERARIARHTLLDAMTEALPAPREEVSRYAPMITTIQIPTEKIGMVIGPRGATIQKMTAETGCTIDVQDDGSIFIGGPDGDSVRRAVAMIEGLTKEVKVGEVYEGRVSRIMNFGAFVEILPGKDGLVHISDLANERVERVEDVLNIGDTVKVQVMEIDNLNRINLSRRVLLEDGGGNDRGERESRPMEDRRSGGGGGRDGGGRDGGGRDGGRGRGPGGGGRGGFDRGPDRGTERASGNGGGRGGFDRAPDRAPDRLGERTERSETFAGRASEDDRPADNGPERGGRDDDMERGDREPRRDAPAEPRRSEGGRFGGGGGYGGSSRASSSDAPVDPPAAPRPPSGGRRW